jgi:hypothetical protein
VEVRLRGMVRELQCNKGKLPKVMWWCGEDWRGVAHGEQKGAGDGGDGGGGARGSGQSKSRNGYGMGREGSSAALEPEEMRRGGAHGQCYGDGEVAAAEPRDGVARAQEGQGGKGRAALGLGSTCRVVRSWRWRRGATEAQHMAGEAALTPAAGVQRAEQRSCQRRKKRGGGPSDLVGNCKILRDFTVNRNFPLIQSSDEKMVKMKVVEIFKTYNFALGLKLRNPKYKVLFHHFALKSNFT